MRHYNSTQLSMDHHGGVVIMGNFDGVHSGHRALIEVAQDYATRSGCPLGVMTFDPHPKLYFGSEEDTRSFLLTPGRLKADVFQSLGFDFYAGLPFGKTMAEMQPHAFIERVLIEGMRVKAVVIGSDFGFAKNREGNVIDLQRNKQFETIVVPIKSRASDKMTFSSTSARKQLQEGNIKLANQILDYPFTIMGTVFRNHRAGNELGFPTANIRPMKHQVLPYQGVYAGRVMLQDERIFDAAINWGIRPTVEKRGLMYEAHLLDFNEDIYNQTIRIGLIEYIRPEQKFNGLNALKEQIARDCDEARKRLVAYSIDTQWGQPINPLLRGKSRISAHQREAIEAATFRRFLSHLRAHPEVQNIDLMILADFCRNCLSEWYAQEAANFNIALDKDHVRNIIYGMSYAEWKDQYQTEQSPQKLTLLEKLTQKRRTQKPEKSDD